MNVQERVTSSKETNYDVLCSVGDTPILVCNSPQGPEGFVKYTIFCAIEEELTINKTCVGGM